MSENLPTAARTLTIINKRGLHARASSRFVKCVENFKADVLVAKDGMQVSGTSIMGLMLLAASQGSAIAVSARGHDADAAINALAALIADRFGEDD